MTIFGSWECNEIFFRLRLSNWIFRSHLQTQFVGKLETIKPTKNNELHPGDANFDIRKFHVVHMNFMSLPFSMWVSKYLVDKNSKFHAFSFLSRTLLYSSTASVLIISKVFLHFYFVFPETALAKYSRQKISRVSAKSWSYPCTLSKIVVIDAHEFFGSVVWVSGKYLMELFFVEEWRKCTK